MNVLWTKGGVGSSWFVSTQLIYFTSNPFQRGQVLIVPRYATGYHPLFQQTLFKNIAYVKMNNVGWVDIEIDYSHSLDSTTIKQSPEYVMEEVRTQC